MSGPVSEDFIEMIAEILYDTSVNILTKEARKEWKSDAPWDSRPDEELCEWERDDYRAMARAAVEAIKTAKPELVPSKKTTPSDEQDERRKTLDRILKIWDKHSHLRFSQLILNAHNGADFYYESNADFLKSLEEFSKERIVQKIHEE
jgi:hypothetical protein